MTNKTRFILAGIVLLIIINTLFFALGYYFYLHPILGDFEILNMAYSNENLTLSLSKANNAISYTASIYQNNEKVYEEKSTDETIILQNFEPDYNEKYQVSVIAQDKNAKEKVNSNQFVYQNKLPSLKKVSNRYLLSGHDLSLEVLGFQENQNLSLEIYADKEKIYEKEVLEKDITIPSSVFSSYMGRVLVYLKKDGHHVLSTINYYLNTPIVGKLKTTTPLEITTRYDDVTLDVSGGENANHFYALFYEQGVLSNTVEVSKFNNQIILPASLFIENKDYLIQIKAVYEDYFEIGEVLDFNVHMGKKETTSAVYVSHNPNYIKNNTFVSFKTITEGATIHYTTNGEDPTINSPILKDSLLINQNMTIKVLATSRNRYDSPIETYQFNIAEKTPVIFLSPSNQNENYGASNTGYTNEMDMMNKVADVVEEVLKQNGLIVYRNNPRTDINAWTATSNYVKADFHFAIHSNASGNHNVRGIEMFIDDETSPSFAIASNIYENLWQIYDGKDNKDYKRGIKYARGSLGEANDDFVRCGSLIEIAYHDEVDDALWVVNHVREIGENLAQSIISYYN